MATLSNPTFQIDILTGSTVQVTGTVNVDLSQFLTILVNAGLLETFIFKGGLPLRLESNLWGNDSDRGKDDHLFSFQTQTFTGPGTYTFSATIPRRILNEDNSWLDNRDEVYNIFRLVNGASIFPINVVARSSDIQGYF